MLSKLHLTSVTKTWIGSHVVWAWQHKLWRTCKRTQPYHYWIFGWLLDRPWCCSLRSQNTFSCNEGTHPDALPPTHLYWFNLFPIACFQALCVCVYVFPPICIRFHVLSRKAFPTTGIKIFSFQVYMPLVQHLGGRGGWVSWWFPGQRGSHRVPAQSEVHSGMMMMTLLFSFGFFFFPSSPRVFWFYFVFETEIEVSQIASCLKALLNTSSPLPCTWNHILNFYVPRSVWPDLSWQLNSDWQKSPSPLRTLIRHLPVAASVSPATHHHCHSELLHILSLSSSRWTPESAEFQKVSNLVGITLIFMGWFWENQSSQGNS